MYPDKAALRRHMRRQRLALSRNEQRRAGLAFMRLALRRGVLRYRHIALYMPVGGELDVLPLLNRLLWLKKQCYLPNLPKSPRQRKMCFSRIGVQGNWQDNRFGISEFHSRRKFPARRLNAVILPLVAFDPAGGRLGMGGGFYDTTFSFLRQRSKWKQPRLIGAAYQFQQVDQLPTEPWDIPLDSVWAV